MWEGRGVGSVAVQGMLVQAEAGLVQVQKCKSANAREGKMEERLVHFKFYPPPPSSF